MDDISDISPYLKPNPEESAETISNSNLFNINPDEYAKNKDAYDEQAKPFNSPSQAEPPVADYMRQSSEHASVAAPDVDHLNYMTRQMKLIGDYVYDRPRADDRIVQLNLKKMNNGGVLNDDDDVELMGLNDDRVQNQNKDYGLSGSIEKIPAQVAGTISQIGQSVVRGAYRGIMDGPFSNLRHPVSGTLMNAAYGVTVKDPYDNLTGSVYNELSNMKDAQGKDMNVDHETKATIARGVGVVGTMLMNGAGLAVAEATPFLKPFINPVLAKTIVGNPTQAAIMVSLGNTLKAASATGGASGLTEVAKIVGEEMARNKATDSASFWNALKTAADKAAEYAPRVAQATGEGAFTGVVAEAPAQVLGFGLTRQRFQTMSDYVAEQRFANSRDVSPQETPQLQGTVPDDDTIDVTPTKGSGGGEPMVGQSYKALQLNEALHNINDVQRATKMGDIAPAELSDVNKRGFLAAGMDKFYASYEALQGWATSPEKAEAARNMIDPSGTAAGQMNAPIEIEPHKFMEVAKQYPDILDHIQINPDGPSAIQAKDHLESLNNAESQRQEVMSKLGITGDEVQPPSNIAELPVKPKDVNAPKYNLEDDVRLTQSLLDEKQQLQPLLETDNTKGKAERRIAEIDKNIGEAKQRVMTNMQMNPMADVLPFPFNGETAATKAEREYGGGPTFTDAIAKVLPKEVVDKYNAAQQRSRVSVIEQVRDAAVHEMNTVTDQVAAIAREDQFKQELDRIANDPNYHLVDKFRRETVADKNGKNAKSIYSIDPKTLTENQLHYLENPRLKQHKVFQKGGLSPDDSAALLGLNNGESLLQTLAKTPTREQVIKARSQAYESHIQEMARAGVDLDHTNIIKAFTDRTAAHVQEMKFMREQEWPAAKSGIKRIALPLPRIEELTFQAREQVKGMTIGSLNPTQFAVGERQSQRIAVDSILKNEVEKAFVAKEAAARNSEVQKEVRIAIAKVNRVQKFARRLQDPASQEILKTAGPLYSNAVNELLDVFNFNPNNKNQAELASYQKWMKRELERGRGDFSIPARLSDIRQSINDMTVEQVLAAGDRMRAVFHEAKFKSELLAVQGEREEERSMDLIARETHDKLTSHPGYDPTRPTANQVNKTFGETMRYQLANAEALFTNMEHILRELDQGQYGGYFQQLLQHQLKGDGKYDKVSGYSKELLMTQKFAEHMHELMESHGDFNSLDRKVMNIPEFAVYPELNNGRLTKADLMVLWANKGDPDGRAHLQQNHGGVTIQTFQKVFDRELETRDVELMQRAVDMFKAYQPETRQLQIDTTGQDVTFIKGVPNEHQGKFYPGGYVPQKYRHDYTATAAKQTMEYLKGKRAAWYEKDDGESYGKQYVAEQTEQGRLIERTDNSKPLDTSLLRFFRGHEEVIHDLSYRKAVMNALQVLRDERISADIKATVGEAKYGVLVNTVIELAGRAEAQNANYFSDQNRTTKMLLGHLQSNFNITVLGMNLVSTAVQYEALTQVSQNLGPKGLVHLAAVNAKMLATPHLMGGYYDFATELDPTIGHFLEGLQNKITSVVHDVVPKKSTVPVLAPVKAAYQFTTSAMMSPMGAADVHLKIMTALASYKMFMAGDFPGYPSEKVLAMTDAERHQTAQAVVRQVSRTSLTHARPEDKAPFQKNPLTEFFSNYWNDLRNVLNNQLLQGRKAKWKAEDAYTKGKSGNFTGAWQAGAAGTGAVLSLILHSTLGRIYSDYLRGIQKTPLDWDVDLKSKAGIASAAERMGYYSLMSPADQLVSVTPLVKDVNFAANMPDKGFQGMDKTKTVNLPITKVLSDVATAGNALGDVVSNAHSLSDLLYVSRWGLDSKQEKAILNSMSYLLLPMPVNAYSKLTRYLDNNPNAQPAKVVAELSKLKSDIATYLAKPPADAPDEFKTALAEINKQIAPAADDIPDHTSDVFKRAISGGDWSKQNGMYGFTQDQWKDVQKNAPELGLTSAGRISQNTQQQEKAADWLNHVNLVELGAKAIPVNQQNLFGAFRLGADDYEKLYRANANTKLKALFDSSVLEKNTDLQNFKTVGQVKNHYSAILSQARKDAGIEKLTPTAENNED